MCHMKRFAGKTFRKLDHMKTSQLPKSENQGDMDTFQIFRPRKDNLARTVPGSQRIERQRKRWEDNIRQWTSTNLAKSKREEEDRDRWWRVVAVSSLVPQ